MSYTAKRVVLLVMAWGLLVFTGWHVREALTATDPTSTAVAGLTGPGPTATPDEEAALQQTLDHNPQDLAALTRLAGLLYDQQDYDSAGTLYERAVQLSPHDPDLLLQLAATQFYRGQVAAAQQTLTEAAALAPNRPDIHLLLGLALSRNVPPNPTGAAAEWKLVLQLAPGTAYATQAQALLDEQAAPAP